MPTIPFPITAQNQEELNAQVAELIRQLYEQVDDYNIEGGKIGGWSIDPNGGLYTGVGATRIHFNPTVGIWFGATNFSDAPFSVSPAGALIATSVTVKGLISNTWSIITAATNAVSGNGYACNTSSGGFTLTLPASPTIGDTIHITDGASTFDTYNLTIGRNGENIMGLAEDMTVSTKNMIFALVYADSTLGWRIA